ncbi:MULTISPECIES: competence protein CoiA [Micrococcaceae]|uniref:Nucleic acid-binding Zn-ribbon protein n=2 Tax=Micrococcaceae TaxID=1268 RepID=A0AAJ1SVY7_9MICC|nr:competence protein CoiA family protein [Pseudarthrobacter niigatensis]MDQ0148076.1 putative nucleic acid-binding Zn-ribbon protein [Pseudarthrobacter niigatensis]MDQ0268122.1 putative nucleic acid-binding Zn-ribbon protein [Pseudarthrobacter niigatensis]
MAYLNGERLDATEVPHVQWRALATRADYPDLVLIECGLRAKRVTSNRGRQFFAHLPLVDCEAEHKSESPQHLAMKRALKERINAAPGWSAEVEVRHPEGAWTADVLAIHENGRRLAFEVQLSQQTEEEYTHRSQRYVDDRIGPVWVVPNGLEQFVVRLPMIVTGFGKTSPLPEESVDLMSWIAYQPLAGKVCQVGTMVDTLLAPSFRWPYGTPRHQLEERERSAREEAERAAAAQEEAARLAEEKRHRAEEAARAEAERVTRFISSARGPGVDSVRPVVAAMTIWASEVRCLKAGHPMLIWRLTDPGITKANDHDWMPRSENFDNVRKRIDNWLTAVGTGLAKAGVHRIQGTGHRRAFTCPDCTDVIRGSWVTALPSGKWSVIAQGSRISEEARAALYQRPAPLLEAALTVTRPVASSPGLPVEPVHGPVIQEGDPGFVGPRRWSHWMSEARDADEIAERQAAKDARAARMREIRENPRYIGSANGFRFRCTDCGGVFEDDNEGIHANSRCLSVGGRPPGWR